MARNRGDNAVSFTELAAAAGVISLKTAIRDAGCDSRIALAWETKINSRLRRSLHRDSNPRALASFSSSGRDRMDLHGASLQLADDAGAPHDLSVLLRD